MQVAEEVRLGDLRDLTRLVDVVDLDPQLAHLLAQALLAGPDLAGHRLEPAGQYAECVAPERDLGEGAQVGLARLQRRRSPRDPRHLLEVLEFEVPQSLGGER